MTGVQTCALPISQKPVPPGECYELGHGVGRNINRAVELYRKAVEGGYKKAEEALRHLESKLDAKGQPDKPAKKRGFFGFGRK